MSEYLTVPEVARFFRVSRMTIYRLVHDKQIRAVKVGNSFRISRAAVDEYVARREAE